MASLRFCIFFLLFCASSLSLVHGRSLPKNIVALFIFGGSMFDPGNNNYINTIAQANHWPYGETFFKHPTGRFSDGRIIPDFIAEYAKLPLIPPYLQPGNHQYSYGVNFASAGAGALAETNRGLVIDLKTQLRYFKNVEKLLRQELGDAEAKTFFSKAVYLIDIGANDYISPLTTNSTVFQTISKEEYVEMVIGNLTDTIKEIYKKGGRKFGLLNLGDLGCFPLMKVFVPGNTGACFEEATELAKLHNAALCKALQELSIKLEGFKYAKHDFNISYSERRNNPKKYGFMEADIACCGSGPYRGIFSCGGKRGVTEYELCSDPSEYLFFDSSHATDKANKQVAELIWSGTPDITGPYNLKALFDEACYLLAHISNGSCYEEATELAELHNKALSSALQERERQLEGFKYTYFNFFSSLSERISNPSKYGFKEVKMACCGSGEYRGILSLGGRAGANYVVCENFNEYLFFDAYHLTGKANGQLAELIWNATDPNVSGPYNLKALINL